MKFLDEAKIYASAGNGGAGSVSFRRERFIARGGPDGGDGAAGGSVIAECAEGLNTLIDYRYQQHFKAGTGENGKGKNRSGAKGKDRVLAVPAGTQIFNESGDVLLGELTKIGERVPLLYGGRGGRGNVAFKSSVKQAPYYAQSGEKGQESTLILRLILIANAGLIGLPNAGKSTLLSVISAATPKIASYPFTTLHPNLGVVKTENGSFVMADIPGLIEGAHLGAGLGIKFLRHIERCKILLHLIDSSNEDILSAWRNIRNELNAYSEILGKKDELIVLTKTDLISNDKIIEKIDLLKKATKKNVISISSQAHLGLEQIKHSVETRLKSKQKTGDGVWQP